MSKFKIEYQNNELIYWIDHQDISRLNVNPEDNNQFLEWINTYNQALKESNNKKVLLKIGQEIFYWLDGDNCSIEKFQDQAESPFIIEFQIPKMASSQQKSFIEVPWELLANNNAFLAQHDILKYSPIRRLGPEKETKPAASEFRLNTVFMAASPRNVEPELDYEQEENALLNLGGGKALPMDLFVEESGNLGQLFDLVTDKKPDVVHISCHGNIFNENNQNQPYLCLEDNKGNKVLTTPNTFCQQFTQHKPKLLFLSACKTAQSHQFNEHTKDDMGSFSQTIIEHSFPAILGWSGSVSDMEATRFAAGLYRELSHAASLENAFAQARSLLFTTSESADPLQQAQKHESKDWHLARLYLGPDGGGEIAKGIKQGFNYEKDFGTKAFLGKKEQGNKVAGREEFVGRRRQIQDILKIFETQQKAGVLIHGIGNQGKSSLAARIANRLANYHTVLIYGKKGNERQYGRIYVLNTLKTVPGIARQTDSMIDKLIQEINQGQCSLKAALKELLEGPFSGKDKKHVPILMVVDDLEKLLNPPQQEQASYSVKKDHQEALIAIITAFQEANTFSRLLLTSRFEFALVNHLDEDIAACLYKLPLASMNSIEAKKQYRVKYGTNLSQNNNKQLDPERIRKACRGNPGLQDLLFALYTQEPQSFQATLEQMEAYLEKGQLPAQQDVQDFLNDLTIQSILDQLSQGEKDLLSLTTAFDIPVPAEIFDPLAKDLIKKNINYQKRLVGFGLLEQHEDFVNGQKKSLQINPLVKAKLGTINFENLEGFAEQISKTLMANWCQDSNPNRPWVCDREILRFALIAKYIPAIKLCAEKAIKGLYSYFQNIEAAKISSQSIVLLEEQQEKVAITLYQLASDVCLQTGNMALAKKYVYKSLLENSNDKIEVAASWRRHGHILNQQGSVVEAKNSFEKAKALLLEEKHELGVALVVCDIAHLIKNKGEMDNALKLFLESLVVFEKLDDRSLMANVLGEIAYIFDKKGEIDSALKLYERKLSLCKKLWDKHSIGNTLVDIGRIQHFKGNKKTAMKLFEEAFAIFDQLANVRSKALVQRNIARIKLSDGEVDIALELFEEGVKVFEDLNDIRAKSISLADIAGIKVSRGEFDEAMRLLEKRLKISEKLENLEDKAYALRKISDLLLTQKKDMRKVLECLSESFDIYLNLGHIEGISEVGIDLGYVLYQIGNKKVGIKIFHRSIAALKKLGRDEHAIQLQHILSQRKIVLD